MIKRTRYYLVSYAHDKGFGNIFYKAKPHLDIRRAEKEISELGDKGIVIISIMKIKKSQFKEAK